MSDAQRMAWLQDLYETPPDDRPDSLAPCLNDAITDLIAAQRLYARADCEQDEIEVRRVLRRIGKELMELGA